jgi:hypothetical protein
MSKKGSSLGLIMHIHSNHWVALVIDFAHGLLLYGDPMGQTMPSIVEDTYNWWLGQHCNSTFDIKSLPCTLQDDTFSCGLLAVNALEHHFLPAEYPLIAKSAVAIGHIQCFHIRNLCTCYGHLYIGHSAIGAHRSRTFNRSQKAL